MDLEIQNSVIGMTIQDLFHQMNKIDLRANNKTKIECLMHNLLKMASVIVKTATVIQNKILKDYKMKNSNHNN